MGGASLAHPITHHTLLLISHYTRYTRDMPLNISLTRPFLPCPATRQPWSQQAAAASQLLVQSKNIAADCAGTQTSAAVAASEPHHVRT